MTVESKETLRRRIRQLKKSQPAVELVCQSAVGLALLQQHPRWQAARTVCLYWALPDEVQTRALCFAAMKEKTVLLPVVQGEDLVLRRFEGEEQLCNDNPLHIFEPCGADWTDLQAVDLVVVPGVAFDRSGRRLGRGRGFYDRFLPKLRAFRMGLCFSFQYLDDLPAGPEDIPMDEVIVCPPSPRQSHV